MQDLVGELSTQSETFRRLWGAHDVRTHGTGTKRFHHPASANSTLAYEESPSPLNPGPDAHLHQPNQDRHRRRKLRLLASLAAEVREAAPAVDADAG